MRTRKVYKNQDEHYDVIHYGSRGIILPYKIEFGFTKLNTVEIETDDDNFLNDNIEEIYHETENYFITGNNSLTNEIDYETEDKTYTCKIISAALNEYNLNITFITTDTSRPLLLHYFNTETSTKELCDPIKVDLSYYSNNTISTKIIHIRGSKISDGISTDTKNINYSEKQRGVADSLIQRLSVIQGELWFNINHGLPLVEKSNKGIFDAVIVNIILQHPSVTSIKSYSSKTVNHKYVFNCEINTIYNSSINLSSSI